MYEMDPMAAMMKCVLRLRRKRGVQLSAKFALAVKANSPMMLPAS